jgi:thiamine biosynthesis lipoprotein
MRAARHFPFRAMGSPCELRLYGTDAAVEAAAETAISEVRRLEAKYSRYRDDSLTARIVAQAGNPAGIEVDDETAALLDYAEAAWRKSEGRFDITSGVLRRAWNWKSGALPSQAQIDALLPLIGFGRLHWQRPVLCLPTAGMELDFGGFVKEYAADRAAESCRAAGIAQGLVDLGGDLAVIGPHPDGSGWRVGIRDPRAPARALASVELRSGGIASSGDYERGMSVGGRRYSHILDPRTGWPARGPSAVTVVAPRCLIAGTASTVAMLHTPEAAPRFLRGLGFAYLCVDPTGRVTGSLRRAPSDSRRPPARSRAL